MQRTFTILKPDTVKAGNAGAVIDRARKGRFSHSRDEDAAPDAKRRPKAFITFTRSGRFSASLVKFMTEGPGHAMVLEAETQSRSCARSWARRIRRRPMPERSENSSRTNIERNAIHGSDGPETAAFEISYFFSQFEIV